MIVADPLFAKQLFTANTDDVGNIQPNLSRILGPGSVFALDGDDHRRRRKMLTPPVPRQEHQELRDRSSRRRRCAKRPTGLTVAVRDPRTDERITLNVILRAVFGADGEQAGRTPSHHPAVGDARLAVGRAAAPSRTYGRRTPWGRLAEYRRQYDGVIDRLIDEVKADPDFEHRDDVLALLLRSTYEDGSSMSRREIADETADAARRGPRDHGVHPGVGLRAGHQAPGGARQAGGRGGDRRQPVPPGRHPRDPARPDRHRLHWTARLRADLRTRRLGDPAGATRSSSHIDQLHSRAEDFPDPDTVRPAALRRQPAVRRLAFIPFGGGTRRCVGAVFANVEMDVVLRTVLRHFIDRDHHGTRREGALARRGVHAEGRRPRGDASPRHPAQR